MIRMSIKDIQNNYPTWQHIVLSFGHMPEFKNLLLCLGQVVYHKVMQVGCITPPPL